VLHDSEQFSSQPRLTPAPSCSPRDVAQPRELARVICMLSLVSGSAPSGAFLFLVGGGSITSGMPLVLRPPGAMSAKRLVEFDPVACRVRFRGRIRRLCSAFLGRRDVAHSLADGQVVLWLVGEALASPFSL